jgi:hypothetical protein
VLIRFTKKTRVVSIERVQTGVEMPGVFEISRNVPVGLAIKEILLITEGSFEGEWEGQVQYLPLCESPSAG